MGEKSKDLTVEREIDRIWMENPFSMSTNPFQGIEEVEGEVEVSMVRVHLVGIPTIVLETEEREVHAILLVSMEQKKIKLIALSIIKLEAANMEIFAGKNTIDLLSPK